MINKREDRLSVDESKLIKQRQANRSMVMGVILLSLAFICFAGTIVKIGLLT